MNDLLQESTDFIASTAFIFDSLVFLTLVAVVYLIKATVTLCTEWRVTNLIKSAASSDSFAKLKAVLNPKIEDSTSSLKMLFYFFLYPKRSWIVDSLKTIIPNLENEFKPDRTGFPLIAQISRLDSTETFHLTEEADQIVRISLTLTFAGIAAALILASRSVDIAFSDPNDAEDISSAVGKLIHVSSYKFIISTFGLLLSIILRLAESVMIWFQKRYIRTACEALDGFSRRTGRTSKRDEETPPEELLVEQYQRVTELLTEELALIRDVIPRIFAEALGEVPISIDKELLSHLSLMHRELIDHIRSRETTVSATLATELHRLTRAVEAQAEATERLERFFLKLENANKRGLTGSEKNT